MKSAAPPLVLVLIAAAACATPLREVPPGPPPARPELPVSDLAQRLGLTVARSTRARVLLTGPGNTITIFPPPARYAYVNGKPVGPVGGVLRVGEEYFVPAGLETRLRRALRPPPPRARPAPRPAPPPEPAPEPARPLPRLDLAPFVVVVDAGHGGKDPGAIGTRGAYEKTVNLLVARRLAQLLGERGATVHLTREADVFVELDDRAGYANTLGADLFVSLHADSAPDGAARGFSVYVARRSSADSVATARAIAGALAAIGVPSRGLKRSDFRVLVKTSMPAVLVEMGFLSNAAEAAQLMSSAHREQLARAIAAGIRAALLSR